MGFGIRVLSILQKIHAQCATYQREVPRWLSSSDIVVVVQTACRSDFVIILFCCFCGGFG